jgi:hypothetical protein
MAKMPKIGDIVWVNDGSDEMDPKPGIIVNVAQRPDEPNPVLNAVIFSQSGNPPCVRRGGLIYSATLKEPDTWAWPPD